MMSRVNLPFELENDVERRIAADPEWRKGVEWGKARRGHPEGAVKHHIAHVLENVDREATSPEERRRLRLAALVHDTFKYRAPEGSARVGSEEHHGTHAARFLERFVDDDELVEVVRWHDEAFAAWMGLVKRGNRRRAEQRVHALAGRLGPALPLFARFFRADNATEGKSPKSVAWFESVARGPKRNA
jgi:HD domain